MKTSVVPVEEKKPAAASDLVEGTGAVGAAAGVAAARVAAAGVAASGVRAAGVRAAGVAAAGIAAAGVAAAGFDAVGFDAAGLAAAGVAAAGDAADVAHVADRKGKKPMVYRDFSVADLEKAGAGSDASGIHLTGVAAVDKPEAAALHGDLQKGGAGGNEEAEGASTGPCKRKRFEYVMPEDVSTYNYGSDISYEGEEDGDSDGGAVDSSNMKSYVRYLLKKPSTYVIRRRGRSVCPFCPTKPKKGMKADLVQHVTKLAYESDDHRERGQHVAVLQVLFPSGEA